MPAPLETRKTLKRLFRKEKHLSNDSPSATETGAIIDTSTASASQHRDEVAGTPGPHPVSEAAVDDGQLVTVEPPKGRWEKAYVQFKDRNGKLAASFESEWGQPNSPDDGTDTLDFKPANFGAMIERKLAARTAKQLVFWCGSKPIKIREQSEKVIKFILASNDYISLATSAQPYASLAWSGISLILPFVLNSSEQNTAMVSGIAELTDLMQLYRIRESLYLDGDKDNEQHIKEFELHVIDLYSYILEFQAQIVHHLSLGSAHRAARSTTIQCPWKSWLDEINAKDESCKAFSSLLDRQREDDFRQNISTRDEAYQRTILDAFLDFTRELQSSERNNQDEKLLKGLSSDYRAGKDFNRDRVDGTCKWILEDNKDFQDFRNREDSALFWFSAAPGCGKSVLSKAIIDERLLYPNNNATTSRICYFFFKDGQSGRNNATDALRAIIHQILLSSTSVTLFDMVHSALRGFEQDHITIRDLWQVLQQIAKHAEIGRLVCVLDALDECDPSQVQTLLESIVNMFRNDDTKNDSTMSLKFFITSRRYDNIQHQLSFLDGKDTFVNMDGNEHSDIVASDIDKVIDVEVDQELSQLPDFDRHLLRIHLKRQANRTYLWIKLIMNIIRGSRARYSSIASIKPLLRDVPAEHSDAYLKLLERSDYQEFAMITFQLMITALEPWSLDNLKIALSFGLNRQAPADSSNIDWSTSQFRSVLENACGMLVQVFQDKVYFLHQTVREFLLNNQKNSPQSETMWHIGLSVAEQFTCRLFVDRLTKEYSAFSWPFSGSKFEIEEHFWNNWAHHYLCMISEKNNEGKQAARAICLDMAKVSLSKDYPGHKLSLRSRPKKYRSFLPEDVDLAVKVDCIRIASALGPVEVLEEFIGDLKQHPDFHKILQDALKWAQIYDNLPTFTKLIALGANIDQSRLLFYCVMRSQFKMIDLIISYQPDVDATDALVGAMRSLSHDKILKVLSRLEQARATNISGALSEAVLLSDMDLLKLLLYYGADVNTSTALGKAAYSNQVDMVELLVDHSNYEKAHNALAIAAKSFNYKALRCLIRKGLNVNFLQQGHSLLAILEDRKVYRRVRRMANGDAEDAAYGYDPEAFAELIWREKYSKKHSRIMDLLRRNKAVAIRPKVPLATPFPPMSFRQAPSQTTNQTAANYDSATSYALMRHPKRNDRDITKAGNMLQSESQWPEQAHEAKSLHNSGESFAGSSLDNSELTVDGNGSESGASSSTLDPISTPLKDEDYAQWTGWV